MSFRLKKIVCTMQGDKPAEPTDLLASYKRCLTLIGVWPKAQNYNLRYILSFVHSVIHLIMLYADFIQHMGNLQKMIMNLSESTNFTIMLVKITLINKNPTLSRIIDAMDEDYVNDKLRKTEEQKKSAVYYSMAKTFYKILLPVMCTSSFFYYMRPLGEYLLTTSDNDTMSFELPCRTHLFFEITNVYTYALIYSYQAIAIYLITIGSIGSDGMIVALVMHVCGQLADLTETIANLTKDTETDHSIKIRSIVKRHLRLIWLMNQVDNVFSTVFLGELLIITLLICMNGFNVVTNSELTETPTLLSFIFYEATMLIILYGYCFVGEYLKEESLRLHEAFYQCSWYAMPPSQAKDLIICMAGSKKPLQFTTGEICVFSLELFTQVVKTAVGYISVLRTLM